MDYEAVRTGLAQAIPYNGHLGLELVEQPVATLDGMATPSIFTPSTVREINVNFAGSALDDPYAFAANGDVSGQPPVYILNSDADPLRSSGEAYAAQLAEAGVEVRLEIEPDTEHGHLNEPDSPGGRRSIDRLVRWLA